MTRKELSVLHVVVVLAAVLVAGCGGGSSSPSSANSIVSESAEGGSAEFLSDEGADKYVNFGTEASSKEREAASEVLEENLLAREKADFSTQCATLSQAAIAEVVGSKKGTAALAPCPAAVKKLAEPLSSSTKVRADKLGGPIAALRVKGEDGYALFHGKDQRDYAMPLSKEAGRWKVGSLVTTELG